MREVLSWPNYIPHTRTDTHACALILLHWVFGFYINLMQGCKHSSHSPPDPHHSDCEHCPRGPQHLYFLHSEAFWFVLVVFIAADGLQLFQQYLSKTFFFLHSVACALLCGLCCTGPGLCCQCAHSLEGSRGSSYSREWATPRPRSLQKHPCIVGEGVGWWISTGNF